MTRQEILQNVFNKLRMAGAVRTRQDFAEKIGYNYTCTSAAFNGAERYLNDRFFTRVLRAFPQVREDYIRTGKGDILATAPEDVEPPTTGIQPLTQHTQPAEQCKVADVGKILVAIGEQQELTRRQQMQTDRALEQIDKLIEIIRTMSADERGQ